MLPKSVKISLKFTVIHTHPLGFDESGEYRIGFSNHPYFGYSETFAQAEKLANRAIPAAKLSDGTKKELL